MTARQTEQPTHDRESSRTIRRQPWTSISQTAQRIDFMQQPSPQAQDPINALCALFPPRLCSHRHQATHNKEDIPATQAKKVGDPWFLQMIVFRTKFSQKSSGETS
mmetsp:Transcript_44522/g.87977  ORF Transcript_44522/g.87977 Transcript_44522/m.87977 type:complete len:106 (+) Transcript_44522:1022-1339(+)